MKTTDIGALGENIASDFLKKHKYKIIDRNLHRSHNEIDIVAFDKATETLVFVEVKARCVDTDLYSSFGTPATAVTKAKQIRTISAAKEYLSKTNKTKYLQIRFDVIEVYLQKEIYKILKINHIENAFGA